MLQMSTIDEKGEPNIQPAWFYYNKNREKLLVTTAKVSKKTKNLLHINSVTIVLEMF
jgi:general stress protein 26